MVEPLLTAENIARPSEATRSHNVNLRVGRRNRRS